MYKYKQNDNLIHRDKSLKSTEPIVVLGCNKYKYWCAENVNVQDDKYDVVVYTTKEIEKNYVSITEYMSMVGDYHLATKVAIDDCQYVSYSAMRLLLSVKRYEQSKYDPVRYNKRPSKWDFVLCTTPSDARLKLAEYIIKNEGGSEFRLTVSGNSYGYEWR